MTEQQAAEILGILKSIRIAIYFLCFSAGWNMVETWGLSKWLKRHP